MWNWISLCRKLRQRKQLHENMQKNLLIPTVPKSPFIRKLMIEQGRTQLAPITKSHPQEKVGVVMG